MSSGHLSDTSSRYVHFFPCAFHIKICVMLISWWVLSFNAYDLLILQGFRVESLA
jgi:hypothetical protein